MVVVDTDYDVPAELDLIVFAVEGPEGQMESREADPAEGLPVSLGLVHEGGPLGPVNVRVSGRRADGSGFVQRRARLDFAPGRTVLLQMDLLRTCASIACALDETCSERGCIPVEVDVSMLPDFVGPDAGADVGPTDTGPADTGVDADAGDTGPMDTGPMDTGPMDTGPLDTGPMDTGPMDTGPVDTGPVDTCMPMTEVCNMADDDCDSRVDEGIDLTSDPSNCGSCGNVCSYPNATDLCVGGFCTLGACDLGFENCDVEPSNGCEVDTTSDMLNCGMCGMACTGMRMCVMSACVVM
jgi:hypothetical protein